MYTYLFYRKQRTKVGIFYSPWQDILSRIPQGSIPGQLLLNMFLCDVLLIINNVHFFASYADDNTPNTTDENIDKVTGRLETEPKGLFKWFSDNQMKANSNKCHFNKCHKF